MTQSLTNSIHSNSTKQYTWYTIYYNCSYTVELPLQVIPNYSWLVSLLDLFKIVSFPIQQYLQRNLSIFCNFFHSLFSCFLFAHLGFVIVLLLSGFRISIFLSGLRCLPSFLVFGLEGKGLFLAARFLFAVPRCPLPGLSQGLLMTFLLSFCQSLGRFGFMLKHLIV